MKIVVAIKQVPDPNGPQGLEADNRLTRSREVALDPGDEYGIEVALRLKESQGGEVVLVSMGPERARDALRKGLSMGADKGILISDTVLEGADALLTARALAAAIAPLAADLVVCGTESYDGSTGMVPPMLAEILGLPQLSAAGQVEVSGDSITVHRQTGDGHQVVEAALPALVSVTAAVGEPRYASLKGIMAARSKEISVVTGAALNIDAGRRAEVVEGVEDAEARPPGETLEDDGSNGAERILTALRACKVI